MMRRRLLGLSFVLMLGPACSKDPQAGTAAESTSSEGGGSEPTVTGDSEGSMGASSITGMTGMTGTTGTTGTTGMTGMSGTTGATMGETTEASDTATTVEVTTDGETTDGTSTGGACEPDPVLPGRCDGGKPVQPVSRVGSVRVRTGVSAGPVVLADEADDELFSTTGCGFICPDETGGDVESCDIFAQDCPQGQKCNAWAQGGGSSWDATKCVPVEPNAAEVGAPCTMMGGSASGLDSCVKGAICLAEEDKDVGSCVELCGCSSENPVCTTADTRCLVANGGVLPLCLSSCDPLVPGACGASELCLPIEEGFICIFGASGGAGEIGDNCEFANSCKPGLVCIPNMDNFPGCDASGCCTPFCEVAGSSCPQGLECGAWYEEGAAPKCLDDVGVCVAP